MPGQADNQAGEPEVPAAAGRAILLSRDVARPAAWSEQIATHAQPPLGALRFGTRLFRRFDTLSTTGTWASRFAARFARGMQRAADTELTLVARLTPEPDFDDREWDAPRQPFRASSPAETPPARPASRRAAGPIARSAITQPDRARPSQATEPQSRAAPAPAELPGAPNLSSPAADQSAQATRRLPQQPGPIARFARAASSAPRGTLPLLRASRPDPLARMGLAPERQDAERAAPERSAPALPRLSGQPLLQPIRRAQAEPSQRGIARWVERASQPTRTESGTVSVEVGPGAPSAQRDISRDAAPPADQPSATGVSSAASLPPVRARSARPLQLIRPQEPGPLARMALALSRAGQGETASPGGARSSFATSDQPLLRPIRPAPAPGDATSRGIARWAAPSSALPAAGAVPTRLSPEAPPQSSLPIPAGSRPLPLLRTPTLGPLMRMGLVPIVATSAGAQSAPGERSASSGAEHPLLRPIRPTPGDEQAPTDTPRGIARWAERTVMREVEAPTRRLDSPAADAPAQPSDRLHTERVAAPPRLPAVTANVLPLLRMPAPDPLARMGFAPAPGSIEPGSEAARQVERRTPEQPLLRPIRPTPGADSLATHAAGRGIARWAEPAIAPPEAAHPPARLGRPAASTSIPASPRRAAPGAATEAGMPPTTPAPDQGRPLPGLALRTSASRSLPLLRIPAPGLPARIGLAAAMAEPARVVAPRIMRSGPAPEQPLLRPIRPTPDAPAAGPVPGASARWSQRSPLPAAPEASSSAPRPTSPTPRAIARWRQRSSAPAALETDRPGTLAAAHPATPGEAAAAPYVLRPAARSLPLLRTPALDLLARMGLASAGAGPSGTTGAPVNRAPLPVAEQPLVRPIRPAPAHDAQIAGQAPRAITRWSDQASVRPETQPTSALAQAGSETAFVARPVARLQRSRGLLPASSDRPLLLLRTPAPDPLARWGLAASTTGPASIAHRGSVDSAPLDQPLLRPIQPARAPESMPAGPTPRAIARQADRLGEPAGDRLARQASPGTARPVPAPSAAGLPREARPALALAGAPTPNVLARMGLTPPISRSGVAAVERSAGPAQLTPGQPLVRPIQPVRTPETTRTGPAPRAIARWSARSPAPAVATSSPGAPATPQSSPAAARTAITPATARRVLPLLRTAMPGLLARMNLASSVARTGAIPVPGATPVRPPVDRPLLRPIHPTPDAATAGPTPRVIARWSEPGRPATGSASQSDPAQREAGATRTEGPARRELAPARLPAAMPDLPLLRAPAPHPLMRMGVMPFADSPAGAISPGMGAPATEPPLLRPIRPTPAAGPAAPTAIARWTTPAGTPADLLRTPDRAATPITPPSRSATTRPLPLMRVPGAGPLARLGRVAEGLAPAGRLSEPDRFVTGLEGDQPLLRPIRPAPVATEPALAPAPRGIARWADHPGETARAISDRPTTAARERGTRQVPGSAIDQTTSVEGPSPRLDQAPPARPRPLALMHTPIAGPLMRMALAAYKASPYATTQAAPAGPLLRPIRSSAAPSERPATSRPITRWAERVPGSEPVPAPPGRAAGAGPGAAAPLRMAALRATALMRTTDRSPLPIGLISGTPPGPSSATATGMRSPQARSGQPLLQPLRPASGPDAAPIDLTDAPIARRHDQATQAPGKPGAGAIQPAPGAGRVAPPLSQTTAGARGLAHSAAIIARTLMPLVQPIAGIPERAGDADGAAPGRGRQPFSDRFDTPLLQRMAWPTDTKADRGTVNGTEVMIRPGTVASLLERAPWTNSAIAGPGATTTAQPHMPGTGPATSLLQRAPWITQAADQPATLRGATADTTPREAAIGSGGLPLLQRMPWTLAPEDGPGHGGSIGIAARPPIARRIDSQPVAIGERAATATLPAIDPAAMDFIQPIRPIIQRAGTSVEEEEEAAAASKAADEAQTTGPEGPDIESLARQVYTRLRRRLMVEAERLGRL